MSDQHDDASDELRDTIAGMLDMPPGSIGEHQNLIGLGMDSISMMRLAGMWRRDGLRISFSQLVARPTVAAWRELMAGPQTEAPHEHASVDETRPFGLALMQHAYWIGRAKGQRLGGVAAHFYHEFDGQDVDPVRLETAVRAVIARHGMLRVQILDDGTQRIPDHSGWPGLRVHDFRSAPDFEARLAALRAELSHRTLDIAVGEVFDVQLSLSPQGTRMHVNLDMVAADALSLRILLADLARCYAGQQDSLPPLDYSYPRYLADRELARQSAGRAWALEADREYWRTRLPDLPGAPQLPAASHETPAVKVVRRHRHLDAEQVRAFEGMCRKHGVTPAMALAAAFAETLTAWSAEPKFLLNLPLFDREPVHPGTSLLVGDFTSSVLLEWDATTPGSFAERVVRLQRQFHADAAHSGYSGVEVLRDLSKSHGEQVLAPVVYTSALGLGELFPAEVRECFGDASWIISQGPQVWLDAQVTELDGGLLANWDAREDAFAPGVLDAMFDAYAGLLESLLSDVDAWERPVPSLLPVAQRQVRQRVNNTAGERSGARLHDRFFAHAVANPLAPALLWGEAESLSYGELADMALRLGGHLHAQGIGPGDLVGICLPKGPDQIVAVLGVLASGAAYLPVGVDQPAIRRDRILRSAGVRAVVEDVRTDAEPLEAPLPGADVDLAYVLYTSGSTGDPKGVELTHAAAMNTIDDLNDRFGAGPADRTLALSALEFDLSVYDMFAPLSVGGAVICVQDRRDATQWVQLLRTHQATVLNCVPALLDMVLTAAQGEALPLRLVLSGGDWVTVDLPGRLAEVAPDCRFVALGGTTETAIHSTVCEVREVPPQWTSIPYGTPLRNVWLRVVDSLGRDCPDWVPGELWIGGAGVARGYRGDPVRTAEKFVDGWYRTGDQARYWPDGTVEFLGRADFQVKVRGVRIELGEVEAALTAHPGVAQAVAVVRDHGVAAAVVPADAPTEPHWHLLGLAPGVAAQFTASPERLLNALPDTEPVLAALADAIAGQARLLGRPVRVAAIGPRSDLVEDQLRSRLSPDSMRFTAVDPVTEPGFDVVVSLHTDRNHAKDAAKLLAPGAALFEVDRSADESLDPARLRDFGAQRLPSAMVPDLIAVVDRLPLTSNGKIDRKAVRDLVQAQDVRATGPVMPPQGEVERRVADVWSDVLHVDTIGREHNFFALGGDSVLATRLVGRLRAAGLDGVMLAELFSHPMLADFAATLHLADTSGVEGVEGTVLTAPEARYEPFPPTDVQRAYWLGRGAGFTLGGIGCHFYREYDLAELDLGRIEDAVNKLIERHEMLRAVFDEAGEQRILREVPRYAIQVRDCDPDELRRTASHRVFDPMTWPLFSIEAVRVGDRTRLAIGIDNLVLDALSILIFYAELSVLYADLDAELPSVDLSFRDYVLGAPPRPQAIAAAQEYWTSRLDDLPPAPRLPLAIDPADIREPRFTRHEGRIDARRWQVITDQAKDKGITPSTVLMAAFAEVLARWSTRTDLTLTVTLFDRREVHPDVNNVMGDFTSLLLVGYRREPGEDWLTAARRLQEELWRALDHRAVSAVWVLREMAKRSGDPELSMPVVFTSALGVPGGTAAPESGPFAEQVWGVSQTPQVWLDHQVTEVDGGVSVNWDVVEELFPAGMVAEMFAAYLAMLDWASSADWSAEAPDLLPRGQREVRAAVNATDGSAPDCLLHQGFFELAWADPHRVALLWGTDGSMTYGDLAASALKLAGYLTAHGVERGEPVAVTVPKGPDQIVAVLGVLAAGAVYVPIGVDQPQARRERIHRLAGVRFVVTQDVLTSCATAEPTSAPVFEDGPAYVIFTSGSTGDPKGVEITHRAAMNTIADINTKFSVGPGDRVLAVSALDFDLSVYDIFGLLSAGGAVVTIEEDDRREARRWAELATRHGVNVWNTVPALLDMLLTVSDGLALRLVLVSGDWVGLDLPGRVGPDCRFIAMGGATEAAIWSNWIEVDRVDPAWRSIPYGFPLRNQRFRVVDAHGRDCPDWVAGELWIGGAGVAEGYRGAPDLTAAQFLGTGDDRWYRTGDLGRYWPDGTLEFLGRVDHQVKIRGHRIELGEIEAALRDCEGVGHAIVGVSQGSLVAGVVPEIRPAESVVDGVGPDLAAREGPRAAEAVCVVDVLGRILEGDSFEEVARRLDLVDEHVPTVRLWLDWLARQAVPTEPSSGLGEYGALIDRAHRRLIERVDDIKAILAGRLDAAVIAEDDVIAPAALAERDPATEVAVREMAKLIQERAEVVVLDERTAARLRPLVPPNVNLTVLRAPVTRVPRDLLHRFDVVVASNVFHRYTDPSYGPALAALLARDGGLVLAVEREELTPIALLTAGLLDRGYAGFDPERRRAGSPTLPGSKWAGLMAVAGLVDVEYRPVDTSFVAMVQARRSAPELDPDALRDQVTVKLPAHMVPERVEVLPWLPLSANGKVDRAAVLAVVEPADPGSATAEPPCGQVEEAIAAMWVDLLPVASIGRDQSFFEAGGDSLLATKFIDAAQRRFGVELPLRKLFAGPTVRAVAALVAAEQAVDLDEGEL